MAKKYIAKSVAPRGGHKEGGAFGEDRVLSVTFSFAEWCKLKVTSVSTGEPMKAILAKAFTTVYGEPTVDEIALATGKSREEVEAYLAEESAKKNGKANEIKVAEVSVAPLNPVAARLFGRKTDLPGK